MKLSRAHKTGLLCSGALTVVICAVMNVYLIPRIEAAAGGLRCFDMRFGYRFQEAAAFLEQLSPEGRAVYLTRQLPLDLAYPLAYCVFFALAIRALLQKKSVLTALPVLLAVCDYAENAGILLMLKTQPLSPVLVGIASAATVAKTLLMYLCFALLAGLLVLRLIRKKRKNAA